jgi:hypothetical protein
MELQGSFARFIFRPRVMPVIFMSGRQQLRVQGLEQLTSQYLRAGEKFKLMRKWF